MGSTTGRKQERDLAAIILVSSILLCQGMAIRGHKEEEGNLVQLMNLRREDVPGLKRWLEKHQYMFHQVVNEMITLMGNTVLHKLLSNIREACWFTIIADEKVTFVTLNNLLLLFVGLSAHMTFMNIWIHQQH